ncbi:MAG TPA: NAD(P)H-hydrate epimerase [Candidatus Omnitrophota bacterium]|nr:NAD(P)H-hydrate epimerase [Candidatus Omnitrophota bacterium]
MVPVTAEKMAEIDEKARVFFGLKQEDLMERAGLSVAETLISESYRYNPQNIIVLSGKGNNGGDGFVSARRLFSVFGTKVVLYSAPERDIRPGSALSNFHRAKASGIKISALGEALKDNSAFNGNTAVIDAIFGTGYKDAMSGVFGKIADMVNKSGARVYSVDVPSGLNATTGEVLGSCFRADRTITFGLPKTGFYSGRGPEFCGKIDVVDIGFPKELLKDFM